MAVLGLATGAGHCASFGTSVRVLCQMYRTGNLTKMLSNVLIARRNLHNTQQNPLFGDSVNVLGQTYQTDDWTNISPKVLAKVGQNLHNTPCNPLNLIRKRIQNFFYNNFIKGGRPLFSVYDKISPVVTKEQNFDNLLVPKSHVSRLPGESYYLNSTYMLRAHTSAHQLDLIRTGLNSFLVMGDVYRRDEIDRTHYPVFHQIEGVRLFTSFELFQDVRDSTNLSLFEDGQRLPDRQECHTMDAVKLLEHQLKTTLYNLAHNLFGADAEIRWVDCYFPFTHPSWEMEVKFDGQWLEVLGCGIMEQQILHAGGAGEKVGWAFGLGLERLAMKLYNIPDIRLFSSKDSGFLSQFNVDNPDTPITYKPISQYPQCINDISFWIPDDFSSNDFYDIARNIGGDLIEQVTLVDTFFHPKTQRHSHCYRIVYRHLEKTLTQGEVNEIHKNIEDTAASRLGVEIR
ncbi:phenylalanine--tRNA ligase, mitochondrial-like [Gigantopelta aegis]|uniref:phenylalanine--tRNA ligase, mitochondrial-like n=1 Tax=Gigantopelta aegis TaxID=1735272 RepID=UPI001B88A103|nr:phenylalanine--tRNA ligase, mitochondrial-like [Gigantopelta aegis]XP_041376507.1 phenylalanine--tRNA ligase, mitochondrial-like [Gigantopelta aegis]XP_041376508.1 phenylalanine--tRNA ligase, mitochondrial-like [Gigantopelta aegis]